VGDDYIGGADDNATPRLPADFRAEQTKSIAESSGYPFLQLKLYRRSQTGKSQFENAADAMSGGT
jgi:hypothetical protein